MSVSAEKYKKTKLTHIVDKSRQLKKYQDEISGDVGISAPMRRLLPYLLINIPENSLHFNKKYFNALSIWTGRLLTRSNILFDILYQAHIKIETG